MKIFNIIMNRKLGGAEQAFLDYDKALTKEGHSVINITSSYAKINQSSVNFLKLPNSTPWCILSKFYLKALVLFHKPDLIIAHGGRAVNFTCSFPKLKTVIGVTHSYGVKHILKCDYIIALDDKLKNHLIKHNYDREHIFIVPNMIDVSSILRKKHHKFKKITIGAMGRLVPEKGFDYLIRAIRLLKDKNYDVVLKLGGEGPLENGLKDQVKELKLENNVKFVGWVKDKSVFFQGINIFCVPSTFETFGIVALEGMAHSIPIIVTNTGGLKNLVKNNVDGLIVDTKSSIKLAEAISILIDNPKMALNLRENAYEKILKIYDIKIAGKTLSNTLKNLVK